VPVLGITIPLFHDHTLSMVTIPILAGITGYVINWTGVWMLYRPLHFKGVHVPGLFALAKRLPRKLREVPGVRHGGLGWQGIIPSRAGKLGSIAVDKQIEVLGSPREFFEQLEPERIAEHIVAGSRDDLREIVERVMERRHPELWSDLTPRLRETFLARVDEQMPAVVDDITGQIRDHIDELIDVKMLVVRLSEENPELTNRLFHEVGAKEFRFMIRFGFVFGFVGGLPLIPLMEAVPTWWMLPLAEAVLGCATNWLGIWMIYEPRDPKRVGPFKLQGLFLRRQQEAAKAYGDVMAEDVLTLENVGYELLHGPNADRTRDMVESAVEPAVDRAIGAAKPAVQVAVGPGELEQTRGALAEEAVEPALRPLADPEFNRQQAGRIRELVTKRMRKMRTEDFVETMRSATREDEWMLIAHGALFGIAGGLLHYVIFGV
jgi:uncharacterized membrane protein YheB (UPF0754 family)